jgi:hypothetical protein
MPGKSAQIRMQTVLYYLNAYVDEYYNGFNYAVNENIFPQLFTRTAGMIVLPAGLTDIS